MSNDIDYNLVFTAPKKIILIQVQSYLEDKKFRWDNRGEKTATELLKETGLQKGAEVVTWGFNFGKIQEDIGGGFSVEVTSWANENNLGNIWISGPEGELYFLMEKFPELEISGSFEGSYGRGSVYGSSLDYESWKNDDDEDENDEDETEEEAVAFADWNPELWEVAYDKNQALKPALSFVSEAGNVIDVALPQEVVIQFCFIPAGSFTMGSPQDEQDRNDDENQVEVVLTKSFWLAKTEVTQGQWEAVMGSNPSDFKGANYPVESVSWEDAQAFITKLNDKQMLPQGWKFALPTEAQWEYACRAGEAGPYSGGNLDEVGWYTENSMEEGNAEVSQKKSNAWGLYDMHGNVWEWCADWYNETLMGGNDPAGPSLGECRVIRGGACGEFEHYCRAASRLYCSPGDRDNQRGFRPALVKVDLIQNISEGDLFADQNISAIVVRSGYESEMWSIMQGSYRGFFHFSDFGAEGISKDDLITWLNKREFKFIKNLNNDLINFVNSFL